MPEGVLFERPFIGAALFKKIPQISFCKNSSFTYFCRPIYKKPFGGEWQVKFFR
jgi:hypothetical protein